VASLERVQAELPMFPGGALDDGRNRLNLDRRIRQCRGASRVRQLVQQPRDEGVPHPGWLLSLSSLTSGRDQSEREQAAEIPFFRSLPGWDEVFHPRSRAHNSLIIRGHFFQPPHATNYYEDRRTWRGSTLASKLGTTAMAVGTARKPWVIT
jgi:hypothetical protein